MLSSRGAAILLTALAGADAWAVMSDSRATRSLDTARRWAAPTGNNGPTSLANHTASHGRGDVGLGGALVYAVDEHFCARMLPTFKGALPFITCVDLQNAVERAFDSWSAHHQAVHFLDAGSERCVPSAATTEARLAAPSPFHNRASAYDEAAARGCLEPEITLEAPRTSAFEHSFVNPDGGTRAALTAVALDGARGVLRTDGEFEPYNLRIINATIAYNSDVCWYLDGSFCSRFHELSTLGDGRKVQLAGETTMIITWGCALFLTLMRVVQFFATDGSAQRHAAWLAEARQADAGGRRIRCTIESNWPWCSLLLLTFAIVFPPVFYVNVFSPCWTCFDFSSVLVHEIGHSLGLHHPDQFAPAGQNMRTEHARGADGARGPSCDESGRWAVESSATSELHEGGSVMHMYTQHLAEACPTQDDIDGLHALYPVCSNAVRSPRCRPPATNLGLMRLTLSLSLPLIASLSVTLSLAALASRKKKPQARAGRARGGGADLTTATMVDSSSGPRGAGTPSSSSCRSSTSDGVPHALGAAASGRPLDTIVVMSYPIDPRRAEPAPEAVAALPPPAPPPRGSTPGGRGGEAGNSAAASNAPASTSTIGSRISRALQIPRRRRNTMQHTSSTTSQM